MKNLTIEEAGIAPQTFRLGTWEVLPERNQLRGPDGPVHVEPKLMRILLQLVAADGRVLSKQTLRQSVWPDIHVEHRVLARRISELRKLLKDDSQNPKYIETVRKNGYRLVIAAIDGSAADLKKRSGRSWPPRLAVATLVALACAPWGMVWFANHDRVLSSAAMPDRLPLTTLPGLEYDPAFSPDGKLLAFSWRRDESDSFLLFVKNIQTKELLQLTRGPGDDRNPAWSPDGRFLAFSRNHRDGHGIHIISSRGGETQEVARNELAQTEGLAWSPDGKLLAYPGGNRVFGGESLFVLDLETRVERQLTFPHGGMEFDNLPTFSPDGLWLAFRRSGVIMGEILMVVPTAGGAPRELQKKSHSVLGGLDWSPDGERLVFSSHGQSHFNLWTIPWRGGTAQELLIGDTHAYRPRFSPDGRMLAYMKWSGQSNIWRADLSGNTSPSNHESFCPSTLWDMAPAWSPQGRALAFHSNRGGSWQVWVARADCAQTRPMTHFKEGACMNPAWSPDGRSLAFDVRDGEGGAIYVVDVETGFSHRVTPGKGVRILPRWSNDGRFLYFTSARGKRWQLFKIPVAGGDPIAVTHDGGLLAMESFDGRDLFFCKADETGIWRQPVSGGPATLVLPELNPKFWRNWAVAEKGIYFLALNGFSDGALSFFEFESGSSKTIFKVPFPIKNNGLSYSASCNSILYVRVDRAQSDILGLTVDR